MNRIRSAGLAIALATAALAAPPDPSSPERERAKAAMGSLQSGLLARLQEELRSGGPAAAVGVCRDEAPAIAARVAAEHGVELGRTSHRLRNPVNAPREWARATVEAGAGKSAADVDVVQIDLGERIGFLRPIPTAEACLQCHGPADRLAADVRERIATAYPEDRATGFAAGELRGWMWAEVPKIAR